MKTMSKKRVIIAGKGASGKDHLRKMMVEDGFNYCVSHTTRPMRSDEEEGIDYYFVKEEEAYMMILEDLFLEHTNSARKSATSAMSRVSSCCRSN
jgi:guanylate kinase